jgi:peptidoglycan/LPS O-acetylase OafA/YrhL
LDAVRFLAALAVVLAHFTFSQYIAGVPYQGALAGAAVAVFFVLSGYVIAYVADQREHNIRAFAVSRMARIYSVAIPAIVLTICIDLYLLHVGAGERVPVYEYRGLWKYLPVFLSFTSEIGTMHVTVLSNGVFWSLSYEVWYYITFALFFYLRGAWRLILGFAAISVLGIPALIYFPTWLVGVLCYRLHKSTRVSPEIAAIGAVSTALALAGLLVLGVYERLDLAVNITLGGWPYAELHNSMHFPSHYLIAILTAAHFFFARYCGLRTLAIPAVQKVVIYLASSTFATYLAHRPLMNFWANILRHDPHSPQSIVLLFCAVVVSVWLFGFVSEHQKDRWRNFSRWLIYRPRRKAA